MTSEEFIHALKSQTSDASLFGVVSALHRPPGRKPRDKDLKLSSWYNQLNQEDQEMVFSAMREAAELAIFSALSILDGVSAIEDNPTKGTLRLIYQKGDENVLLNDPGGVPLHDLYNELCRSSDPRCPSRDATREYAVGLRNFLKSLQSSTDGLDIQPIPKPKSGEGQLDSSSILLPKAEHRKL